jgi:hypothetical protein
LRTRVYVVNFSALRFESDRHCLQYACNPSALPLALWNSLTGLEV